MLNTLFGETLYRRLKPLTKIIFYKKFHVVEGDFALPPEEPFLLVGHYVSTLAPILINCFSNRLIRFLYEESQADPSLRQIVFKRLEMIPFHRHMTEYQVVRKIHKALMDNRPVGIFPAGEPTWDGQEQVIRPNMAKLVKYMGVAVYGVRFYGGFLSKPRWAKYVRRGTIKIETYLVMSAQEVETLSIQQIEKQLLGALHYNEMAWQQEVRVQFKGKHRAEHIEHLLYACPECGAFNCFTSHKHAFVCNSCDTRFCYSVYGAIEKNNARYSKQLQEWVAWQASVLDKVDYFPECRQIESYIDELPYIEPIAISNKSLNLGGEILFREIRCLRICHDSDLRFYYKGKNYRMVFKEGATMSAKFIYDYIKYQQNCI